MNFGNNAGICVKPREVTVVRKTLWDSQGRPTALSPSKPTARLHFPTIPLT